MGLSGPPRKPPSERVRGKRTKNDVGTLSLIQGDQHETPDLPKTLGGRPPLKHTREAWDRLWSAVHVMNLVQTDADMSALLRWADLTDTRERALRMFNKQPLLAGSQDQLVRNPMWTIVKDCDKELRALEDRFGGSLSARLRLGIELGEAARSMTSAAQAILNAGADDPIEHDDDDVIDIDIVNRGRS